MFKALAEPAPNKPSRLLEAEFDDAAFCWASAIQAEKLLLAFSFRVLLGVWSDCGVSATAAPLASRERLIPRFGLDMALLFM